MKKIPVTGILYTAMFLLAGLLVLAACRGSSQAAMARPMPIHFEGEYCQKDGEWQTLDAAADLSAYQGDITLRGSFDLDMSEGEIINFYLNHIGVDISRNGEILYESSLEKSPGMCGSTWLSCDLPAISREDVLEIRLVNRHSFGNRNAYRQFLDSIYTGSEVAVENYFKRQIQPYNALSIFILVVSVALIGTAVGYWLLRLPDNSLLLKAGVMSLMMGSYMYLDARDISFWSGQLAFNTNARRLAMMLAASLLVGCGVELLQGKNRQWAKSGAAVLLGTDFVLMAMSLAGSIPLTGSMPLQGTRELYDTGIYWVTVQSLVSLFLMALLFLELRKEEKGRKLLQISVMALLTVLLLEFGNAWMGWWKEGLFLKIVFSLLFVFHIVRAAWLVAKNHRESIKAEQLREELKNSRIILAMSQIQTHFVFNILNAISGMCEYDPQKADETLVIFSNYLRNNINIMEDDEPEPFPKALNYLEEYVHLEQVRFGEKIHFAANIEADNFKIPPLVLQPLVENAIRHGLLHKKQGGTVELHTWMDKGDAVIEISDDGVGFDTQKAPGEESVGMKNVRFRLKYMVDGTLEVKSTPGQGTIVTIRIPGK